jgi:hypothetical protein
MMLLRALGAYMITAFVLIGWAGDAAILKAKKAVWNADLRDSDMEEEDNGIVDTNVQEWKQARTWKYPAHDCINICALYRVGRYTSSRVDPIQRHPPLPSI